MQSPLQLLKQVQAFQNLELHLTPLREPRVPELDEE